MIENIGGSARALGRLARASAVLLCALSFTVGVYAAPAQRSFASPEEAADALVQAVKAGDRPAIVAIIGPGSEPWLFSSDKVVDKALAEHFVDLYGQKHSIALDGDAKGTLALGPDDWPFAFPLVKANGRWRFDTKGGKTELLARRVGNNELAVINVMLAIVDAQRDYASADRNRDGVREYARKFQSTTNAKDGLYWPTATGEAPSPLGELMSQAAADGYRKSEPPKPFHGYYFRMLTGQGAHAKDGALDYIVKGHMIGGFAAVAYPAQYGNTGVKTFIVNHDGVVYEKDLGAESASKARAMTRFDPSSDWTAVSN